MPGLHEALEEAYESLDAEETPAQVGGADHSLSDSVAPVDDAQDQEGVAAPDGDGDRARDDSGRFVAKPAEEKPAPPPAGPTAGQGAAAGVASPSAPAAAPAFKPPQSWRAAIREKWAGLPAEVQAEVVRREKEVAQALQARAEAEKGNTGWQEAVRPYEAQIRASGVQPVQYVGDLLKTAHALSYGHPQQKADVLANIIMQFGVPPQDLDNALVARMNGRQTAPAQQQPQEFRDPRLDQFFAQQETQAATEAEEGASGFADTHEFFNDVAEDIANILDSWKAQGKTHVTDADLERAYRMACYGNDDVVEAMNQRKAVSAVQTAQAATQRARDASSSLKNQPTAAQAAQPTGRRSVLEDRYDELDR